MMYERKGRKSPLYPTFHGKLFGIYQESEKQQINMKYDVTSKVNHQSLVTLTFVADSVSFVENRYIHVIPDGSTFWILNSTESMCL